MPPSSFIIPHDNQTGNMSHAATMAITTASHKCHNTLITMAENEDGTDDMTIIT
jgi:hypothetical protein